MEEEIGGSSGPSKIQFGFMMLMLNILAVSALIYASITAYNQSVVEKYTTHLTYETTIDSVTYKIKCYVRSREKTKESMVSNNLKINNILLEFIQETKEGVTDNSVLANLFKAYEEAEIPYIDYNGDEQRIIISTIYINN